MRRLRELDFLRGIAIILVLLRHKYVTDATQNMGWIGVDLFFVLSGFLVSGLLFKEYKRTGGIQAKRFLIRRGFKIYPIFYIFSFFYVLRRMKIPNFSVSKTIADLTFVQNYVCGWGYTWTPSWSLAVEEHFYFGLSLFIWLWLRYAKTSLSGNGNKPPGNRFGWTLIAIMVTCLVLRLVSNVLNPALGAKSFTMTHLRIDSLLAGVFIAYWYHFNPDALKSFFSRFKYPLYLLAFAGLCWTPFIPVGDSFFMVTIGFTLLYLSFGIILLYVILTPDINQKLDMVFSRPLADLISKIGFCSYSIYVIHSMVNGIYKHNMSSIKIPHIAIIDFVVTSAISVAAGMIMTYVIERYFLNLRDKYFPSRAKA